MPLPLAMMIPFMGIQSAVMAKQFGENFQYGKRRISAMSNEEFNKLTPQIINEKAAEELKSMIPSMEKSIIDMQDFQTFLIKEFIKMIGDILTAGLGKVLGINESEVNATLQDIEHFIHGHPDLHKGTTGTTTTTPTTVTTITPEGTLAPPPVEFPKTDTTLNLPSGITPAMKLVFDPLLRTMEAINHFDPKKFNDPTLAIGGFRKAVQLMLATITKNSWFQQYIIYQKWLVTTGKTQYVHKH